MFIARTIELVYFFPIDYRQWFVFILKLTVITSVQYEEEEKLAVLRLFSTHKCLQKTATLVL